MAGLIDLGAGEAGAELIKQGVGLLDGILDKIAPDKMSDGEKAQHRYDYEQAMQASITTQMSAFYDLVKTQMSSKINVVVDTFRGLVRPVITMTAWGFYCYIKWILVHSLNSWFEAAIKVPGADQLALTKEFALAAFNFYDFLLLSTIIGFWFGGRELQRYMARAMDTDVRVGAGGLIKAVKKSSLWSRIFGGKKKEKEEE